MALTATWSGRAGALEAVREGMGHIRAIAEASEGRSRATAAESRAQEEAMEQLAATSLRAAETASTLDALAGRFQVAPAGE